MKSFALDKSIRIVQQYAFNIFWIRRKYGSSTECCTFNRPAVVIFASRDRRFPTVLGKFVLDEF